MDCLIGMDLGTTNYKCAAFDARGRMLAQRASPAPSTAQGDLQAVYEPDRVWRAAAQLIRETVEALPAGARAAGIAVASVGESVVPLDEKGQAVFPAFAWFDARPRPLAEPFCAGQQRAHIGRITGIAPDYTFSAFKAMWLRREHPGLFARVRAWLPLADYIAWRLCGAQAVSLSLASRTMLMNLEECKWSDELFGLFDLEILQWPELAAGGTRLGAVRMDAARETGLPEGAAVAAGGHDHLCGALAAGATEPGVLLDSMGTTEAVLAPLARPLLSETLVQRGYSAGCHAAPGRYYVITGITGSGALMGWLRGILLGHIESDDAAFRQLEELAVASPPGANGARIWPCFAGANPRSPGAPEQGIIRGLGVQTTAGDLARAAMEALSAEFKRVADTLARHTNHPVSEILLTGGGSANALWRRIKAAMMQKPLAQPEVGEAGCLGAAMLAGIGAGLYRDHEDARGQVIMARTETVPHPADMEFYSSNVESFQGQ